MRMLSAGLEPARMMPACRARLTVCLIALGFVLPALLSPYLLMLVSQALVLSIACLSVNLLLGYSGLIPLGHAAYFGIGGYAGAFLFTFGDLTSLEMHLASGAAAAAVLAALLGFLCTRSTKMHFSILTLAFGQVIHALFISGAVFRPFGPTGRGFFLIGNGGLYVPRFTIAGLNLDPETFGMVFYYVVLGCAVASAGVMWRIVSSPFGKALCAIRDSETRAQAIGIRVRRYRWAAVVLSGTFAGLAGAMSAQLDRQITPQQLDWILAAQLVVATVLGGTRRFLGPAIGAFSVVGLRELSLRFPVSHNLVLGVLLLAIISVCPGGLAAAASGAAARMRRFGRTCWSLTARR